MNALGVIDRIDRRYRCSRGNVRTAARTAARVAAWLAVGARWILVALIRAYQVGLRPLNPWGCKFQPTCSGYALEAVRLHGPWRGAYLAAGRLLRCRPGTFGGIDPVPEPEDLNGDSVPVAEATGLNKRGKTQTGSAHRLLPVGAGHDSVPVAEATGLNKRGKTQTGSVRRLVPPEAGPLPVGAGHDSAGRRSA